MTISTRIALGISAAALSLSLVLAPAAFAQDKMGKDDGVHDYLGIAHNTAKEEALSALIMLGFNKIQAGKALDHISKVSPSGLTVEQLIKEALKIL